MELINKSIWVTKLVFYHTKNKIYHCKRSPHIGNSLF